MKKNLFFADRIFVDGIDTMSETAVSECPAVVSAADGSAPADSTSAAVQVKGSADLGKNHQHKGKEVNILQEYIVPKPTVSVPFSFCFLK